MIVSLCDRTGNMVKPWADAGFKCLTVDLQQTPNHMPNRTHVVCDVADFEMPAGVRMVFAFPPCTDLAGSGARWWKDKGLERLIGALTVVNVCRSLCEQSGAPWMIENPVGRLASCWREPDHTFHPVHYSGYAPDPEADAYTKKTCLWTGGGFVMPDRKPGEPTLGSLMHRLPPSDERQNIRSQTPIGFAYAVFEANRLTATHMRIAAE